MGNYLQSAIPYMGNKYKLLDEMLQYFPVRCGTFYDLFGGSATVSMNYKGTNKTIYNEFNIDIVELVKTIKNNDPKELHEFWVSKVKEYGLRTQSTKEDYQDGAEAFNKLREDYNKSTDRDYRILFLLVCYAINHLIRFNSKHEFNAPNGADSYNKNNYYNVSNMHRALQNVEIRNDNALELDVDSLDEDTFLYCDPPYLNTEAVYNEKRAAGGWDINCDYKLFEILEKANQRGIKWGLSNVFANRGKVNQHLKDWCKKNKWHVYHLDRNYHPFFTNGSANDEVYICNYETPIISLFDMGDEQYE